MKSGISSRDYLNKYFPENRVVESFYNKLVRKRFSESRKLKHLYCLKKLFSLHDLTKIGPQELTEILEWIESTNYAPESKRDLRITLKRFLEHVGKKDLTDFRTSVKSRERKRLPEILSDEEIENHWEARAEKIVINENPTLDDYKEIVGKEIEVILR